MATKADKDALKKNAFWIALGGFVLLWLIAVLCVMMAGDSGKKKAWDEAKTAIDSASKSPKNEKFFAPWDAHGEQAKGHKDRVWDSGWKQQEYIYNWPERMEFKPRYPTDAFGPSATEELDRRGKYRDVYKEQFADLDRAIAPALFRGGFASVFPMQRWDLGRPPTREEIWLAQEDFWVRRELLYIIQDAMNAIAVFKDVTEERLGKDAKLPEGVAGRKVFRNANWELDLMFVKGADSAARWDISPDSTIKNVNRTQKVQPLASVTDQRGLPFRLYQPGGARHVIRIAGEPLAYEQVAKIGAKYNVAPVRPAAAFAVKDAEPLGVQQVLEWETSPIRQLNAMELAYHSHRTITWGLKVNDDLKKLDPDPVAEGAEGGAAAAGAEGMPPGAGSGPGSSSSGPPAGGIGGFGGGASAAVESTRINSIARPRYMQVTKQCRHMPIAIQAVIDQNHIHDLLGAVANSPLRIQITQVAMASVPTPPRPNPLSPGGTTGSGTETGMGPMGGPMASGGPVMSAGVAGFGGPRGPGGSGFRPGEESGAPGMGGSGTALRTGESVSLVRDTAKMVELTVHGIATLYDRPPVPGQKVDGAADMPK